MPSSHNEWTPRERGLMIGYKWASSYEGDPFDLKPTAAGEIDDSTRTAITALLVESDDIENPSAFWGGFSHGVAAYLVEQGITSTSEPPAEGGEG